MDQNYLRSEEKEGCPHQQEGDAIEAFSIGGCSAGSTSSQVFTLNDIEHAVQLAPTRVALLVIGKAVT